MSQQQQLYVWYGGSQGAVWILKIQTAPHRILRGDIPGAVWIFENSDSPQVAKSQVASTTAQTDEQKNWT